MLDLSALGSRIRDARLKQGWRPIDFALEMGWSGTAPVYRLERPTVDTPRPTPDTINQVARVLALDYADRMFLLGLAGHLPETELLTEQEEAHLVALTRQIMETANEPMILYDYRERILAVNAAVLRPFRLDAGIVRSWREHGITALDLLWDASHGFRAHFLDIDDTLQSHMLRFKLDNRLRRHEGWYRAFPACYAHYPGFVALWEQTEAILDGPIAAWDLGPVVQRTTAMRGKRGRIFRFDASRRSLHAGYGLATLGIYSPKDETTRRWLASLRQRH